LTAIDDSRLTIRDLMNYRLTLQYDGTDFHGWQVQNDLRTVQGELTRALSLIDGSSIVVHGAGRTDAGVHAEGQEANVHLRREIDPMRLRAAINGNVARDLRVIGAESVPDDFHARFSARGKTYCYRIFNSHFVSPFWLRFAHHERRELNVSAMQQIAPLFLGAHDWTAFSCARTDVSTRVRNLTQLEVTEQWSSRGKLIEITVSADGFLRYMVRSIAGTLLAVGRGQMDEHTVARAITGGDRMLVGPTAQPHGLTLMQVHYNAEIRG